LTHTVDVINAKRSCWNASLQRQRWTQTANDEVAKATLDAASFVQSVTTAVDLCSNEARPAT